MFRYHLLDAARERARAVSQKGALFPWRTINGQEASAYYAAGTAQYHINAAIAYAIRRYVQATGDEDFLRRYGAEILVETARLWYDLGFFSERQGNRFCIHGVTGPDEYTTVVDNNTYTNLMARLNLRYAAEVVEQLHLERGNAYTELVFRTELKPEEPGHWRRAAEAMYVAYDEKRGIHPQDDSFLEREVWDFAHTPPDHYPLLLHYHPLVIYRHQVLKQADVVFAMFLLDDEFTEEQRRRNFDYYDPLTTDDSSLSACIQSIVAAELGYRAQALRYWEYALLMDMADVGGNVKDGCHVAALAGSWMAVVYGLAGMRERQGRLCFDPRPYIGRVRFALIVRGQRLEVQVDKGTVTYRLQGTDGLTIEHRGATLQLSDGEAVTRDVAEPTRTASSD
jgi:alpha,alpha-trehalose phosphorylase